MDFDLIDLATNPDLPLSQDGYFEPEFLKKIFSKKISRSPATGKDGTRVAQFSDIINQEVILISDKIKKSKYKFTPYKERLILKGSDKLPRQISIPTIRDKLTIRALCELIHRSIPKSVSPAPHTLISKIVHDLRSCKEDSSFIRIDVQNFFPSILHEKLCLELIRQGLSATPLELCRRAISTPTGKKALPSERGVPQGLSISGALAQIYMIPFDNLQFSKGLRYYRYVDDILLLCDSSKEKEEFTRLRRSLAVRGLKVHPVGSAGKTEIKSTKDGIDFLGYHIAKDKRVRIRDSSYRRMFSNIMKVFTDQKYRNNINRTVFRLNLKITGCITQGKRRGWMMFFSRTENMSQLKYLDKFLLDTCNRYNLHEHDILKIKNFTKTYHEIRYNLDKSKYIPNFDLYSNEQRIQTIALITGKSVEEISTRSTEFIEIEFSRLLAIEIADLEQDVGGTS